MKYLGYGFGLVLMSVSPSFADPAEDYDSRFLQYPWSAECAQKIKDRVAKLVTDHGSIRKYDFVTRTGGYDNSQPTGYEVWVSFKDCKGNLVVETNASCQLTQSYTRGNCQVPGVKNY